MPIVRTAQAIRDLPSGMLVEVLATDPGSQRDFVAWCRVDRPRARRAHDGWPRPPLLDPPEVRSAMTPIATTAEKPLVGQPGFDALTEAIADVEGIPETFTEAFAVPNERGQAARARDHLLQRRPREDVGVADPRDHRRRERRADQDLPDLLGPPDVRQGRRPDHRPELDAEDALGHAAAGHQPPEAVEDELPRAWVPG